MAGEITIENNTPFDASITAVSDVVSPDIPADESLSCGVTFPYTLASGATLICDYSADLPDGTDRVNTATVETDAAGDVGGGEAEADVVFDQNSQINKVNAEVNVTDDYGTPGDTSDDLAFGPLGDGESVKYSRDFVCSSDPADYTFGTYSDPTLVNTSTIDETGDYDDASVDLTCYIPSIEKTADGTYDERHEWEVEKKVDPSSQSAFIGDTVTFDWTITVDETIFEENFDVSGTITVDNPNPEDALVVSLEDWVNGTMATIDQSSCNFDGTDLTVAASGSETCEYSAENLPYDDVDLAPDTNTATITLNGIDFSATDPIEYTANVINGSATLDDDQFPYTDEPVDDSWSSTYERSYTCSTDQNEYTDGADMNNEGGQYR